MPQITLRPEGLTGFSRAGCHRNSHNTSLPAKITYFFNARFFSHLPASPCVVRWQARKGPVSAMRQTAASAGAAVIGLSSSNTESLQICDALIVGAGPAGLGAALLLAQRQGWERIVVLEKRPSIDMEEYDRSYVYGIDWRGFSLMDAADLYSVLETVSIPNNRKPIHEIMPDGTVNEIQFSKPQKGRRSSVWLPRRAFLATLHKGLTEAEQTGRVKLLNNVTVTSIHLAESSGGSGGSTPIVVCACDNATGQEVRFAPRLLVGADGMNSDVRRALSEWAPKAGLPDDHFSPVVLDSPSAGLRFKSLPLQPNPTFRKMQRQPHQKSRSSPASFFSALFGRAGDSAKSASEAHNATTYAPMDITRANIVVGVKAPRNRAMWFGIFPIVDPAATRTVTVVAPAEHVIWSLTSGPQLGAFLQDSFPQLDISSLFTQQQLDTVAASRGGAFPRPQYLRHFTAVLPAARDPPAAELSVGAARPNGIADPEDAWNSQIMSGISRSASAAASAEATRTGVSEAAPSAPAVTSSPSALSCGVALLGDAVHCFPPDLGQGVNSTAMDVLALAKALDEASGDLARALPLYEARQAPEAAALVDLTRFGSPYQYRQDKFRGALWFANFLLRKLLSQLAPWVFSPQVVGLLTQTTFSYTEIRKRAHETTRRMWALAGVMAALLATFVLKSAKAAASTAAMTAAIGV
ncbi:hypothetical protein VaNZ11_005285 [Volvox africanus]|uniref:FAD-binding domain-containing protein n=1 Tax=Volvox africanus TaxID=51714 RepID=A0ABQ5RYY3_9CHLO|nr:hypothetical protein VaNZ11_005285 [Volvox africanus]